MTHTDAMRGQIAMMNWSRQNLAIVATEAGADWVIPYVDVINQSGGGSKAILVPLYQMLMMMRLSHRLALRIKFLQGILFGGQPELPFAPTDEKSMALD